MNTFLIILAIIIILLVLYAIYLYNKLIKLNVAVNEAFAQIEVQLKRRANLIPNLVETVKGYASHEKEALERVTQARAASVSAQNFDEVSQADGMLTQALRGLLAISESYPDLKASTNFIQLQEELSTTENKISFARQFYNQAVRALNTAVTIIPSKFFTGMAKITKRDFYEVEDPSEKQVPNVKF